MEMLWWFALVMSISASSALIIGIAAMITGLIYLAIQGCKKK